MATVDLETIEPTDEDDAAFIAAETCACCGARPEWRCRTCLDLLCTDHGVFHGCRGHAL